MRNERDVAEWTRLADMDVLSANHLNEIRHPKPLEMICYHCQQAAEKMLKALALAHDGEIQRTHDLGMIADDLSEFVSFPEDVLNSAADLTPYAVRVRYPQDLRVEEAHVVKAISDMKKVYDFAANELNKMRVSEKEGNSDSHEAKQS